MKWHWTVLMLLWFGVWGFVSAQTPVLPLPDPNEWNWRELVFHAVFFVLIFGVPTSVAWASYSENKRFRNFDVSLLWKTETGALDKLFIIVLGTWWVHTCAIVLWTLARTVVAADFPTYIGWGIPIIARMFAPTPGTPAQPEVKP